MSIERKTKLSIDLSVMINKELVSRNLRKSTIKSFEPCFTEFYESELKIIEELTVTNCYDISELKVLPNLKKLYIKSTDYNKLAPFIDYRESTVINHIQDFSVISELTNLVELVVANDLYIKSIDLSNLTNLTKLILINNPNLEEIVGLDKLKNLNEVTMYGNNITKFGYHIDSEGKKCPNEFDIDAYSANTRLCAENSLDISMYLSIINNNKENAKHLVDNEICGKSFLRFAEKSGFLNCVCLSSRDLYDLYTKLDIYFKKLNSYEKTDYEKLELVFNYIINNTKFNKELIVDRNIQYLADREQFDDIPVKIRKLFNSFHSSFFAYRFKEANCEGRVNLMVFMLEMLGVHAHNVHCHDNRSNLSGSNHSIVRVLYDDKYKYIDASIFESFKDNKKEMLKKYSCKDMAEFSRLFFLADYDFMCDFVTFDAYEESLNTLQNDKVYKLR